MSALESIAGRSCVIDAEEAHYAFRKGKVLRLGGERYIVCKPLGAGNVGDVYLVEHENSKHRFAMKHLYYQFATDPKKYYGKLQRIAAHSNPHPAFIWPIAVSDYDSQSDSFCFLMPLVPEGYLPLSHVIVQPQTLTLEQKLDICRQLAEAFSLLQKIKWVYGDCSANNFLYRIGSDGKPQVKILDCDTVTRENCAFGLAGSGLYRAPEVFLGRSLTLQSDTHALASVLFHILVGCNALNGSYSSPKAMTEADILRYYGKKPVFIFDQSGKNKPLQPELYDRFAALPDGLQAYFRVMFSQSRLTGQAARPGPDVLCKVLKER